MYCLPYHMHMVYSSCKIYTGVKLLSLGSVLKWTIEMRKPLLSYLEVPYLAAFCSICENNFMHSLHVQTALKEKTKKDLNHISDGWIVTSPNSVCTCLINF